MKLTESRFFLLLENELTPWFVEESRRFFIDKEEEDRNAGEDQTDADEQLVGFCEEG